MNIGEKIRKIRTLKGYSQENMAEILGISSISYGDIERGRTDISYSRLQQIAKAFGMNVAEMETQGEKIANIFNSCYQDNVITGNTNSTIYVTEKDLLKELEENKNQNKNLTLQKEKSDIEVKYWKEKYEREIYNSNDEKK